MASILLHTTSTGSSYFHLVRTSSMQLLTVTYRMVEMTTAPRSTSPHTGPNPMFPKRMCFVLRYISQWGIEKRHWRRIPHFNRPQGMGGGPYLGRSREPGPPSSFTVGLSRPGSENMEHPPPLRENPGYGSGWIVQSAKELVAVLRYIVPSRC